MNRLFKSIKFLSVFSLLMVVASGCKSTTENQNSNVKTLMSPGGYQISLNKLIESSLGFRVYDFQVCLEGDCEMLFTKGTPFIVLDEKIENSYDLNIEEIQSKFDAMQKKVSEMPSSADLIVSETIDCLGNASMRLPILGTVLGLVICLPREIALSEGRADTAKDMATAIASKRGQIMKKYFDALFALDSSSEIAYASTEEAKEIVLLLTSTFGRKLSTGPIVRSWYNLIANR